MATEPHRFVNPEEYLEFERKADSRSELFDGVIYGMAGASRNHNIVASNTGRVLGNQLVDGQCELYQSDMRVRIPNRARYFYPDLVVVCGKPRFEDEVFDTLVNPTLVIEVLSPTTERFDRGRKFESYRQIESLREFVMISHEECRVVLYTRQPNGQWLFCETTAIDGVVQLGSIECELPVAEVYRKIDFEPTDE